MFLESMGNRNIKQIIAKYTLFLELKYAYIYIFAQRRLIDNYSMTQEKHIDIKPFNPNSLPRNPCCAFSGPKGSGKSYCARSIAYHLRQRIYDATVFTGTTEQEHPWTQFIPDLFVYDGFYEDVMANVIERQQKRSKMAIKKGMRAAPHLIIFEDLEYKKKNIFNNETVRRLMLNGRHDEFSVFALVQYVVKGITLENRSMFTHGFFTKEPNMAVRKTIWRIFGGICTFDDFDAIFKLCTDNHRVFVINIQSTSYDISESFYYYVPEDRGIFHIGHPDFWIVAEQIRKAATEQNKSCTKKKELEDMTDIKTFAPKTGNVIELTKPGTE